MPHRPWTHRRTASVPEARLRPAAGTSSVPPGNLWLNPRGRASPGPMPARADPWRAWRCRSAAALTGLFAKPVNRHAPPQDTDSTNNAICVIRAIGV